MGSRVIFINRYFYPDQSATSQLLVDLTRYLADRGADVHVITSRMRHDNASSPLEPSAQAAGATVHRVWTTRFGRDGLIGRTLDYLTFYLACAWSLSRLLQPGDTVVAKTDPPLIGVVAALPVRLKKARLVNWLQDLYPEIAVELEIRGMVAPLVSVLTWMRDWSLQSADKNVVIGERMARRLVARGVDESSIQYIPNWSDAAEITIFPKTKNTLRKEWGLADKFVLGYSGNLGRSHEFGTAIDAAARLVTDERVAFLFVGGGAQRDLIAAEAKSRGLVNCHFRPYQPREHLAESLGVPDVHLVSLKPQLEGLIVPSKIYGVMAAGRPVLFVGDSHGEIGELVVTEEIGFAVAPGDVAELTDRILYLAEHAGVRQKMGRKARKLFVSRFDRHIALSHWASALSIDEEVAR